MRYLITNDDGINAAGLKILAKIAKKLGDVVCVAPLNEQSAKSHSINIRSTYLVEETNEIIPGVKTYVVDSTPADCVRVAYYYLNIDFDVVLSGVNNGYNLGEDIFYSGTIGAATQGVLLYKKGIAFSTTRHNTNGLEEKLKDVFRYLNDTKIMEKVDLLNINIPSKYNNICLTKQGRTNFQTEYEQLENNQVKAKGSPDESRKYDDINSDVITIANNDISITPLLIDHTDYRLIGNK